MCFPPGDNVAIESTGRRPVDDDDEPHVCFEDDEEVHVFPSALSCLGDDNENDEQQEDKGELWYTKSDFQRFRRQALQLSQQLREKGCCAGGEEEEEVCTRGLELKMSLQRQDRKQMIVKRIIDAQDDEDATPDELAEISIQHSVYSRKLALAQGHKDYYAAYHPGLASVPHMPALDCHKDVVTKKRSLLALGSHTMTGRRVRVRMF